MKLNKLILAYCVLATVFLSDTAIVVCVMEKSSAAVEWTKIASAVAIQIFVIAVLTLWLTLRNADSSSKTDSQFSYRSQFPITAVGFVLIAIAFSFCLLYIGIACPGHSLPMVRGKALCS